VARLLPRPDGGSALPAVLDVLTPPYRAGIGHLDVPLVAGRLTTQGPHHQPVLLVRLHRPLVDEALVVTGTAAGTSTGAPAVFAPWSSEGSLLLLLRPELVDGATGTGGLDVEVVVTRVSGPGAFATVPDLDGDAAEQLDDDEAAELVGGTVLEGLLGRVLYLADLEKQRIDRLGRELRTVRHLPLARAGALDSLGADLGVPRRQDPPTVAGGPPVREDDEHYRARLAIYRSWRLPTPGGLAMALNGPGDPTDPNAGLPSRVGVTDRFEVSDERDRLSLALKLVHRGAFGAELRAGLHDRLRRVHLVDLDRPPPVGLPTARARRWAADRDTLAASLVRDGGDDARYLAPRLAGALARAVRVLDRLDDDGGLELVRAHVTEPDGHHELGQAATITPLEPGRLDALAAAVAALDPEDVRDDPRATALAAGLQPRSTAEDPAGAWLFEACGLPTVHPSDLGLLLSVQPTFGQLIEGPDEATGADEWFARYHPPGSAGVHVRAAAALDEVDAAFAVAGLPAPPAPLAPAARELALDAVAAQPAPGLPGLLDAAVAAGLVSSDPARTATDVTALMNLDQVAVLPIPEADLAAVGDAAAVRDRLAAIAGALGAAGFASTRGVWDAAAARLLVLASVSVLPGSSASGGAAPPVAYRWQVVPIGGDGTYGGSPVPPVTLTRSVGGRVQGRAAAQGLGVLASIGWSRTGLADPYEVKVGLPAGAVLDLDQYGFVMNLLDELHPTGVMVDTFDIRRRHVDVDGDGEPEWLSSRVARTYLGYQRRRAAWGGAGRPVRGGGR
jgi:hypothetical protein